MQVAWPTALCRLSLSPVPEFGSRASELGLVGKWRSFKCVKLSANVVYSSFQEQVDSDWHFNSRPPFRFGPGAQDIPKPLLHLVPPLKNQPGAGCSPYIPVNCQQVRARKTCSPAPRCSMPPHRCSPEAMPVQVPVPYASSDPKVTDAKWLFDSHSPHIWRILARSFQAKKLQQSPSRLLPERW